jgi:hypothetical protein
MNIILTVQSVIDPTDGGNSVASANDELVVDTLVVHAFRLGKLQGRKVQPKQKNLREDTEDI